MKKEQEKEEEEEEEEENKKNKKVLFQHFPEKLKKINKIQHLVKKASLWPRNNLQHSVICHICPKI